MTRFLCSGLGFAICERIISEFIETRSTSDQKLLLIPTTRSRSKADDTLRRLVLHLSKVCARRERVTKNTGIAALLEEKVDVDPLLVDLNSILSVQSAAQELNGRLEKRNLSLDVLLCNAGIGGWTGVDWWGLIKQALTKGPLHMASRPGFKIARVGAVLPPQLPAVDSSKHAGEANGTISKAEQEEEPPLGEVFCANVFGHYLLGHWLAPSLLRAGEPENKRGRLIWVSTLEAYPYTFSMNDIQGIASPLPYESSKRLTDLLALTSELPSTQPYVSSYFSTASPPRSTRSVGARAAAPPKMYLSQPGICATTIMPIPALVAYLQVAAFYVLRVLCGSYWHTVSAWSGATAPAWLALAASRALEAVESADGKAKWGSVVDVWGRERAVRTEVQGWGFGGRVGEVRLKSGRWDPWTNSEESLVEFEELGMQAWREMERLRVEWESRITRAELEEEE